MRKNILILLLSTIVLALGGFILMNKEKFLTISPESTEEVISAVSKHFLIPGEIPTVANIEDPQALKQKNPQFYAEVEKGDKLLVFRDRILLYRPTIDKIIAAAFLE